MKPIGPIVHIFLFISSLLLISGCAKMPVISNEVSAEVLTQHAAVIRAYEIPEGKFRGAVQPVNKRGYFHIWNIENNREIFYDIPSPRGFPGTETEKIVTDEWNIRLQDIGYRITYQATRKDGAVSLQFKLPPKKRQYTIYVLRNNKYQELIVFGDLSEFIVDKGIFGYIMVCRESDAAYDTKIAEDLPIKRTQIP